LGCALDCFWKCILKNNHLNESEGNLAAEIGQLKQTQIYLQTIVLQAVLTGFLMFIASLYFGKHTLGILWGGFCACLNVLLILWRMNNRNVPNMDASRQLRLMYRSVLERFFIVMGLIAFGMVKLHYTPLGIMLGFVSGQFVMTITSLLKNTTYKDVNS